MSPRAVLKRAAGYAAALVLGTGGAVVFYVLHLPLPWMLGAMVATTIAAFAGLPILAPHAIRPAMSAVIGAMLGASFSMALFSHLGEWVVPITGLVLASVTGTALSATVLRRLTGMSWATAYFAGMPGGVIEMVTFAESKGGDERIVALIQSSRIFLVVLSLPFILHLITGETVGRGTATGVRLTDVTLESTLWFIGVVLASLATSHFLRLPARFMLAPMIGSAIVHMAGWTDFRLPVELIALAQIVIGTTIGARFAGMDRRLILKMLGVSVIAAAILLATAAVFAAIVALVTDNRMDALLLAYAPGGLAEMSLVALAINIDVAFVVLHHVVRVLLVVSTATVAFDFIFGRRKKT